VVSMKAILSKDPNTKMDTSVDELITVSDA
jgi:hypothetical protein